MKKFDSSTIDRITLGIMKHRNCSLEVAMKHLSELALCLKGGDKLKNSCALQAAFATSLNCAQRAFKGGVRYELPDSIPNLIPNSHYSSFNEFIQSEFGMTASLTSAESFTLLFGLNSNHENELEVVCNGWQGGVATLHERIELENTPDFALGGIAAGSLGVALAFLKSSGIAKYCTDSPAGISLWNPQEKWTGKEGIGPSEFTLPNDLWILGLGHLGQAYTWTLKMMPFKSLSSVNITLQDYEKLEVANIGSGLLSRLEDVGMFKVDVCNKWLQRTGFNARVIRDKFTLQTPILNKSTIALCGFDNAAARAYLEDVGFSFIVEAGLGSSELDFDKILMHTFPNCLYTAKQLWIPHLNDQPELDQRILNSFNKEEDQCGVQTIAGKAVSTSFVGAFASALIFAEIIRHVNGGIKTAHCLCQLRKLSKIDHQTHIFNIL